MLERIFRNPEQDALFAQHLTQFRTTPTGTSLVSIFETIPGVQMSQGSKALLASEELMGNPENDILGGRLAKEGTSFVWGGVSPDSEAEIRGLSIISFIRMVKGKFNSGVTLGFNAQGELVFGIAKGLVGVKFQSSRTQTVTFKATGRITEASGQKVRPNYFISIQKLLGLITQPDFADQPQNINSLLHNAVEN